MNRSKAPASVGDILDAFLKSTGLDVDVKEWDVVGRWDEIVGDRIAAVTKCGRVEDGILYVKVTTAPWRQELSYMKDAIKEKIANVTECGTIKDIVFY